ncbi:hypothetical protein K3495_g8663 [Podosphaera aphanis]|nr:hypothetical protein K3495_g8663 [Podosphaera aphanis]
MSEPQENLFSVSNEHTGVSDASQFLQEVQHKLEAVLGAIRALAQKNLELSAVATQAQVTQENLVQKDVILLSTANDLETAQEKIKRLEKKVSASTAATSRPKCLID